MSSSRGAPRRSGDPRKRSSAAASSSSPTKTPPAVPPAPRGPGDRRWAVVAALAVGTALVVLALLAMRPDDAAPDAPVGDTPATDPQALTHAEAACDLATKAGEAADAVEVDKRSRYAAAVLLLDRAIIESARAAESDPALGDLDFVLQEVHTAGHEGDPKRWEATLATALDECRSTLG